MRPPKVEDVKKAYERRSLDKQDVTRFDELIDQQLSGLNTGHFGDETLESIIEDAEKWDNVPRDVHVIDFWRPPEVITDYLKTLGRTDKIESPGIEGIKFSQNLIEAGRAMDSASHGYLIEVKNRLDDTQDYNPHMIGSVSMIYEFIPMPEEYQDDDIFTESQENQKLGIIEDDYTVIAQQGLSAAEWMDDQRGLEIPYEFKQAIRENIDSYTPLEHSDDSTERS